MSAPPHIGRWHDQYPGDPSEAFIRKRFAPPHEYRVSRYTYPAGTRFAGLMRPGTIFILTGSCSYKFGEIDFHLNAGDVAELPGGADDFSVHEAGPVDLILVWKL